MTYRTIQNSFITILCVFIAGMMAVFPAQADPPTVKDMVQKAEEADSRKTRQERRQQMLVESDSPIVVELFTTSDCGECVFADRMLYDASLDKRVIPLSCRITDLSELENRKKSKDAVEEKPPVVKGPIDPCIFRQWTYQGRNEDEGTTLIFPNFVFNGFEQIRSGSLSYFDKTLKAYHYTNRNRILEVFMQWKDNDTVTIHMPRDPKIERQRVNASVWLIRYKDMEVQRMDSGVNKGRVLRFSNIIQDIRHIAKWHGHMRTIDVDVLPPEGGKERGGFAVVVQELMGEPILAAGKLVDYPHPNDEKEAREKKAGTGGNSTEREIAPKAPAPAAPVTEKTAP